MLSYETAVKLKETGFPQKGVLNESELAKQGYVEDIAQIYIPTLSELIEACGEQFGLLEKSNIELGNMGSQFIALQPRNKMTIPSMTYSSSPEEAVANLWLALHK